MRKSICLIGSSSRKWRIFQSGGVGDREKMEDSVNFVITPIIVSISERILKTRDPTNKIPIVDHLHRFPSFHLKVSKLNQPITAPTRPTRCSSSYCQDTPSRGSTACPPAPWARWRTCTAYRCPGSTPGCRRPRGIACRPSGR
jgi:hypothetical protein